MSRPIVVGYYTENTPYENEADVLKLSLEPHGYEHDIEAVPNLGSWQKNTQYKARVILNFLNRYAGKPILYLDVDAIMVSAPVFLDDLESTADIAAVHFADSTELLSGTVYFSGSPICTTVAEKWIALNKKYPKRLPNRLPAWDQRTLKMAIDDTPECRYLELPQEYTYITELTPRRIPGIGAPVILHTRGAYRFKRQINIGAGGGIDEDD